MSKRTRAAQVGLALLSMISVTVHAGSPGTWTKISNGAGSSTFDSALLRTPDGKAHAVWPTVINKKQAYGHTAVMANGTVGRPTTVLSGWGGVHSGPQLLPDGSALRLIFSGLKSTSTSDPYSTGAMYTATSKTGTGWVLGAGSLSQSGFAYASLGTGATLDLTGTPVVSWSFGIGSTMFWHAGLDSSNPAASADHTFTLPGCCNQQSALATDAVTGTVWLAWYSSASGSPNGYFARALLPSLGPRKKAPKSSASGSSIDPLQSVALSARRGAEGAYLAYSNPGSTRLYLWKLGTTKVLTVPDSAGARYVVLTPGADGRLWILWYVDGAFHSVLTDEDVTTFGAAQTFPAPPNAVAVYHVAAEGSTGKLDVVVNIVTSDADYGFWHTQVVAE